MFMEVVKNSVPQSSHLCTFKNYKRERVEIKFRVWSQPHGVYFTRKKMYLVKVLQLY